MVLICTKLEYKRLPKKQLKEFELIAVKTDSGNMTLVKADYIPKNEFNRIFHDLDCPNELKRELFDSICRAHVFDDHGTPTDVDALQSTKHNQKLTEKIPRKVKR